MSYLHGRRQRRAGGGGLPSLDFYTWYELCYFSVFFPLALPWKRLKVLFFGLVWLFSVFFPLPPSLGNFSADALGYLLYIAITNNTNIHYYNSTFAKKS